MVCLCRIRSTQGFVSAPVVQEARQGISKWKDTLSRIRIGGMNEDDIIPRFKLVETTKLLSADAIRISNLKERASNPQTILKFRPRISFDYRARNGPQPIDGIKYLIFILQTRNRFAYFKAF